MTRTALWLQSNTYTASIDRRLGGALWPSGGVSGLLASAPGGTMTLSFTAGSAAVPSTNNTGSTLCSSDATDTLVLPAPPVSGANFRYELIIVRPRGTDLDGGGNNDWIFDHVASTEVPSPAIPATPAGTLAIATVFLRGGTSAITPSDVVDRRPPQLLTQIPPKTVRGQQFNYFNRPSAGVFSTAIAGIPAPFVASRLIVRIHGGVGFAGATGGADFDVLDSAVSLWAQPGHYDYVASEWRAVSMMASKALTIGAVPVITYAVNPSTNCWFNFQIEWEVYAT